MFREDDVVGTDEGEGKSIRTYTYILRSMTDYSPFLATNVKPSWPSLAISTSKVAMPSSTPLRHVTGLGSPFLHCESRVGSVITKYAIPTSQLKRRMCLSYCPPAALVAKQPRTTHAPVHLVNTLDRRMARWELRFSVYCSVSTIRLVCSAIIFRKIVQGGVRGIVQRMLRYSLKSAGTVNIERQKLWARRKWQIDRLVAGGQRVKSLTISC